MLCVILLTLFSPTSHYSGYHGGFEQENLCSASSYEVNYMTVGQSSSHKLVVRIRGGGDMDTVLSSMAER